MNQNFLKWACVGFVATISASAYAQTGSYTILSTFNGYNGQTFGLSSGETFGQNISLGAANYSLTGFEFEYAVPGNFLAANVGVDISFYNVNSSGAPVGTPFYNSGFFYNTYDSPYGYIPASSGGSDLIYGNDDFDSGDGAGAVTLTPGYLMPVNFLVSVEFTNISANQVTLPIATNGNNVAAYSASVANDYWVNNGGVWSEYTNAVGNNMLFSFTGVPEPTTFALTGIGSLVLLGAMKLRRKS